MATQQGDNATLFQNDPVDKIVNSDQGGKLRMIYDEIAAAALPINEIIEMGAPMPNGARLVEVILIADDLGTVGTLDVGWAAGSNGAEAADPNGILNAINVNAAASVSLMSGVAPANPGLAKKFVDEVQLIITASAATDAAGTIKLLAWYTQD